METTEKELTGYPSIDKPWLKYYSEEAINAPIPQCTVYENIFNRNKEHLDDIALIYYGRKITYRSLFDNVEIVKHAFEKSGVKKGDIVVVLTSSTPETVYTILALCRIGAIANMVNPLFDEQQIIDRINETNASILILLDRLYSKIQNIVNELCVKEIVVIPVIRSMPATTKIGAKFKLGKSGIKYDERIIEWKHFIIRSENSPETNDVVYENGLPFVMVYSSGTTGASKGILLTNNGINATISHYTDTGFKYDRSNIFLHKGIMIFFSTGMIFTLFMPLVLGVTVLIDPSSDMNDFVNDITKYNLQMIMGATSFWKFLIQNPKMKNIDLSTLNYPITGGEQTLSKTENEINTFLKEHGCRTEITKGYGMCELGSTVVATSLEHNKLGSPGYPIKNVIVSIFNTDTNAEMKYHQKGEIRVLSPARMKEYYKNPEATNNFFYMDNKGNMWGCTGDVGYMDEDGFLFVLGRANDSFISASGKTIYCFDIENVILQNENISRCKVVGVKNNKTYVPIAHIVIDKSCELSEDDLVKQIHKNCLKNLEPDAIPFGYKFRDNLPIKPSGKMDVEALKNDVEGIIKVEK